MGDGGKTNNSGLYDLLNLQQSDGSFAGVDITTVQYRKFCASVDATAEIKIEFLESLYVLYLFANEYPQQEDLWRRAAKKLRGYLSGMGVKASVIDSCVADRRLSDVNAF